MYLLSQLLVGATDNESVEMDREGLSHRIARLIHAR